MTGPNNSQELLVAVAAGLLVLGVEAIGNRKPRKGTIFLLLSAISVVVMYWPTLQHRVSLWITPVVKAVPSASLALVLCLWLYIAYTIIIHQGEKRFARQFRDDVASLRSNLDLYVKPRTLSSEQVTAIASYLSKYDPQGVKVKVVANDSEAANFMGNIVSSIVKGGWRPLSTVFVEQQMNPGLSIQIEHPGNPQPLDPKRPTPDFLLGKALQEAGIAPNGVGNAYNMPAYALTISIGPRPLIVDSSPPAPRQMPPSKGWR